MKIVQMILTASIASMLVAAPVGFARAVDAHHPAGDSATKQAQPKLKKKIPTKKNQAAKSKQSGQMAMSGMMTNCPMMRGRQAGHGNMKRGNMMTCPMMSADGASMPPWHSLRMQWHHNMMMWYHQMMHGQSPMHRGS